MKFLKLKKEQKNPKMQTLFAKCLQTIKILAFAFKEKSKDFIYDHRGNDNNELYN